MSTISLFNREINIKVVYYGPGLGGKTSSLQYIHRAMRPDLRGQLVSLATGIDRTLYFDFLPVKLPKVKDFTIRMSLYTVPGQVHYNATRKLVLQGCDGVVFVADSQAARHDANKESISNLEDNLRGHGLNPDTVPLVIQYNKRDLEDVLGIDTLQTDLNPRNVPAFETCALSGQGIFASLKTIAKLVLTDLKRKGIYQDKQAARSASTPLDRAPVVNPQVEQGLVKALETCAETATEEHHIQTSQPAVDTRGLTFSDLWTQQADREPILAIENDIERGDYPSAVKRSKGVLLDVIGASDKDSSGLVEALLMLGVHGRHYARFLNAITAAEVTKSDALFCLFFLTDLELRMQAAGMRIE